MAVRCRLLFRGRELKPDLSVLESWYLAKLRRAALQEAQQQDMTPATLISADRELVEKLVLEKSRLPFRFSKQVQDKFDLKTVLSCWLISLLSLLVSIFCYRLGNLPAVFSALSSALCFAPAPDSPVHAYAAVACFYLMPLPVFYCWLKSASKRIVIPEMLAGLQDPLVVLLILSIVLEAIVFAAMALFCGSTGGSFAATAGMATVLASFFPICLLATLGIYTLACKWLVQPLDRALAEVGERLERALELPGADQFPATLSAARMISFLGDKLAQLLESQRAIVQYSPEIICALDAGGRVQDVSGSLQQISGYRPVAILGRSLQNFLAPEYIDEFAAALLAARNDGSGKTLSVQFCKSEGGLCDLDLTIEWSSSGQQYFLTGKDVTAVRVLERAKKEFVSMISHDLRTPLTSLRINLEAVELGTYGEISAGLRELLGKLQKNIDRLLSLINELLDLDKSESGCLKLDLRMEPLSDILAAAGQGLSGFAAFHRINLLVQPTDLIVWAESDRLIRVVSNLLSNAIKFSPEGETIEVAVKDLVDSVEVQVTDRGKGIPAAHLSSIFERFRQVALSDSSEKKGSGLGLSICRALIAAHGGTIGVRSEVGRGSTFWFRIKQVSRDELEKRQSSISV
jgi:PAS domain S-box-containing protein